MPGADFGIDSSLTLPEKAAEVGRPSQEPLDDPVAAMRAALTDPLGFPPLKDCVIPGDRVAVVLGESLLQPDSLVAGTVLELLDAGIEPSDITILRHSLDARLSRQEPTRRLPKTLRSAIPVAVHDPNDREQLAMLNVSAKDKPIYFSRCITEADVVLPIGLARQSDALGYLGTESTLFPAFADLATQRRFQKPKSVRSEKLRQRRLDEIHEAIWMLGVQLIVEVVPGPAGQLMNIVAGNLENVRARSRELCDTIWRCEVSERASLVVAAVPGGREQQSWANVARAVASALRVVEDEGTIAICSDLRSKPGKSMRRLGDPLSTEAMIAAIERDATPDALTASQFVQALQRTNIFLLSRLDEECVQSLGLGYVESAEEVNRLAQRHESCILLQNAQQVVPVLSTEISS